jgi:hypothetical protein
MRGAFWFSLPRLGETKRENPLSARRGGFGFAAGFG